MGRIHPFLLGQRLVCKEKMEGSDSAVTTEHFSLPVLRGAAESGPLAQGPLISRRQVMDITATAGSGTGAGHRAALPRGSQSLWVRASPSPCLNPGLLKFSKCATGRRRYFSIWGLEPLILKSQAWQSSERLYSPVPADTSAPGSLAQQKG